MKGLLFLSLLLFLAVCLTVVSQNRKGTSTVKENFEAMVTPTPGPPPQPIGAGEKAKPYNPPTSEILTAPFGQTSDVTSRPFQDPALDKATYARLYQLLQDLNAFHDLELEKLQDTSDPQIALPLNTFRADRQRLMDEVSFLNRNPGLQSTLTVGDAQAIRVNLTYLQKKARALHGGQIDLSADLRVEGFENAPAAKATEEELKDASFRISMEVARLQASGTTDPVFQARINILSKIRQTLDTIVDQLKAKTLLPEDVPVTSKDLKEFLPTISNPASPVSKFMDSLNAPPGMKNLFPAYEGADISGAQLANAIFSKYGDSLFSGLSWDLKLNYTSPTDLAKAKALADANQFKQGFQNSPGSQFELGTVARTRGDFDKAFGQLESDAMGPGVRPVLPTPNTASFDWKARSAQICEAVRKQGLDPADFGCLANTSKVGDDFSWRGYTKMVCTRLQTTTDSGLPDACGCPPVGWPGWRQ
jgi:hypothetical protein